MDIRAGYCGRNVSHSASSAGQATILYFTLSSFKKFWYNIHNKEYER